MKITMFSNAMSHHQKPFCDSLSKIDGVDFHFVAAKPLAKERAGMGYSDLNHSAEYIVCSYESDVLLARATELAQSSDFVIYGSAPYSFIKNRLRENKWTFLYSERIFKDKKNVGLCLRLWLLYFFLYGRYVNKRVRVLCAGAYAAHDFYKLGFRDHQLYKWGYFPKASGKDNTELISQKKENSIVWVGRMIALKHPETAVRLAERLRNENIPFHLTMIGNGILEESVQNLVRQLQLEGYVTIAGALPADEVRAVMGQSEVMITTSDQNEGWGAVINEAMSEACAVCASCEMGAAPFLIQDGMNGFLFHYDDHERLFACVHTLLTNVKLRKQIAQSAYDTIRNEWNGENAARKLTQLCKNLEAGEASFSFLDGICSFADKSIDI